MLVTTTGAAVTQFDTAGAHLDRPAIAVVVTLDDDLVAAERRRGLTALEQVDHGEVRDDPRRADARRLDVSAPDVAARALGRVVAHGRVEDAEDLVEVRALAELVEQIRSARAA